MVFLHKLLNGVEKSKVIVIQETLKCRGFQLFQSFLKSWSMIPGSINHLVLLEKCVQDFDVHNVSVVDIHNVSVVDVLGQFTDVSKEQNYVQEIRRQLESLNGGKLFIDSLDPLIVGESGEELKELISWCAQKFDSIVTVMNGTLSNEQIDHGLKRLSTTWIQLRNSLANEDSNRPTGLERDRLTGLERDRLTGLITRKKKHRRVDFVLEYYEESFLIDTNSKVISIDDLNETRCRIKPSEGDLPNLTFNLNLREEERVAKESLLLPYIKQTTLDDSMSQLQTESKVLYYPDENDDVDEDDPDDDLGI